MLNELQLIKSNFNHAANTYIANAVIQNAAAKKIAVYLDNNQYKNTNFNNNLILDLGSGPGTFNETNIDNYNNLKSQIVLYDLSLNMLKIGRNKNDLAISGNASVLPFANNSFALVISNLMLQWPKSKLQILHEIRRVLKPNGCLIFTTLVEPSLCQLKAAWQQIDNNSHTLNFATNREYQLLCYESGLEIVHSEAWEKTEYFSDIYALFRHFKLTGTSLPKSKCNIGLGGRKYLNTLANIYPKYGEKQLLPLNYNYLIMAVRKSGDKEKDFIL